MPSSFWHVRHATARPQPNGNMAYLLQEYTSTHICAASSFAPRAVKRRCCHADPLKRESSILKRCMPSQTSPTMATDRSRLNIWLPLLRWQKLHEGTPGISFFPFFERLFLTWCRYLQHTLNAAIAVGASTNMQSNIGLIIPLQADYFI